MYNVIVFLSILLLTANAYAIDCEKGNECAKSNIQPNLPLDTKGRLDETLNTKLKQYDKNRINKSYTDKYGVTIERNVGTSIDSGNPSLDDQIKKSKEFKKVYEGPKDIKSSHNLGLKLSIPLERD
jgi:uncharacterized protein